MCWRFVLCIRMTSLRPYLRRVGLAACLTNWTRRRKIHFLQLILVVMRIRQERLTAGGIWKNMWVKDGAIKRGTLKRCIDLGRLALDSFSVMHSSCCGMLRWKCPAAAGTAQHKRVRAQSSQADTSAFFSITIPASAQPCALYPSQRDCLPSGLCLLFDCLLTTQVKAL